MWQDYSTASMQVELRGAMEPPEPPPGDPPGLSGYCSGYGSNWDRSVGLWWYEGGSTNFENGVALARYYRHPTTRDLHVERWAWTETELQDLVIYDGYFDFTDRGLPRLDTYIDYMLVYSRGTVTVTEDSLPFARGSDGKWAMDHSAMYFLMTGDHLTLMVANPMSFACAR